MMKSRRSTIVVRRRFQTQTPTCVRTLPPTTSVLAPVFLATGHQPPVRLAAATIPSFHELALFSPPIIPQMAGVRIPRAALRPFFSAPCEIRGLAHLPGNLRVGSAAVYGLGSSRALGGRAYRRDVRACLNGVRVVKGWDRAVFSTSAVRRNEEGEGPLWRKAGKEKAGSKVSLWFLSFLSPFSVSISSYFLSLLELLYYPSLTALLVPHSWP